ncbi:hypothetical protein C8R47DRAFT_1070978 [Mycena vitilis]|nr:hypothetical protein C8R47DRAFT_1070978 [Mycena vitilis]
MDCLFYVGSMPSPTIVHRDGTVFVAYNCSANLIPDAAWKYVDQVWYFSSRVALKEDGFAVEMEWAKEPDWHRPDRDWTEWIPTCRETETQDLPWYHVEGDTTIIKKTQYNRYLLETLQRDEYLADLKAVWDLVDTIRSLPQFPPGIPTPVEHAKNELYTAKDSVKEAMGVAAASKRKMLEFLGFINWWIAVQDEWDQLLAEKDRKKIEEFRLQEYGKRGVILNLARDHPTINLQNLLKHNVPIIYAWTAREDTNPRFARLAPILLKAYKDKRKDTDGEFRVFDGEHSSELYRYLFDYDRFFEPLPPEFMDAPELTPTQLRTEWLYFMIDGEGFGRRSVPEADWRHYYALRFYYRTFGDLNSNDVVVVFYRNLKKEINLPPKFKFMVGGSDYDPEAEDEAAWSSSDEDHVPTDRVKDAKDDDFFIREFSRLRFGPRPGQKYDSGTGLEVERAWTGPQSLTRWNAVLNSRVPASPDSPTFRRTRNFVKLAAQMILEGHPDSMDVDEGVAPGGAKSKAPVADDDIGSLFDEGSTPPTAPDPLALGTPSRSLLNRVSPRVDDPEAPPSLLERMTDSKPIKVAHTLTEPRRMRGNEVGSSRASSAASSYYATSDRHWAPSRERSSSPPRRNEQRGRTSKSLSLRRRSPITTSRRFIPSEEQESRMLTWLATDLVSTLSIRGPTFPSSVSEQRWNPRFLEAAYLRLPEAYSRIWARYIVATDATVRTPEDLLDRLIDNGIAFGLAVKDEDARLFRPSEIQLVDRKWGSSAYSTNVSEEPLLYGNGGQEFVERWGKRCKEVLSRDHARVLVSLGGIFAWLALASSRDTLVPAFKNGPSKQVTIHRRGWTDVADPDSLFLVGDEMSADELNLLLGKLNGEDKFIWPRNDFLWDFSAHYSGSQNAEWLSAMRVIERELDRFEPRHRTRAEFRELLRKSSRTDQLPPPNKVTRDNFQDEETSMTEVFTDDWKKIRLRDLSFPGVFRKSRAGN